LIALKSNLDGPPRLEAWGRNAHDRAPTCLAFDNQAKLQMSGTALQGSTFDNSSEDLGAAHIALARVTSSCTLAYWNKALLSRTDDLLQMPVRAEALVRVYTKRRASMKRTYVALQDCSRHHENAEQHDG